MADKLGIIKAAVIRAGGEPPQSLNDDSDDVIAAVALYDSLVTEMLCAHAWSFATRWETISRETDTPPLPYKSQYAIPAECINVRDLLDPYGKPVAYEIVENKIYTFREDAADEDLTLVYNWWPAESRWPPDFAGAVQEFMVARVLESFEERLRALEREEIASRKLTRAMNRDARQNPPRKNNRGPLLRAWRNRAVDRQ